MHANKNLSSNKEFDNLSNLSIETDLSDVGLCALNVHEFSYNIALCYLKVRLVFINSG